MTWQRVQRVEAVVEVEDVGLCGRRRLLIVQNDLAEGRVNAVAQRSPEVPSSPGFGTGMSGMSKRRAGGWAGGLRCQVGKEFPVCCIQNVFYLVTLSTIILHSSTHRTSQASNIARWAYAE